MEMEIPSVRVLVVGDSGVGKTALLSAVCREPASALASLGAAGSSGALLSHRWTTGCDAHVLLHRYRETTGAEKEVYVEFIDVGGHRKYEISRAVFYHDVHGVIFVHDLSNAKSYEHLRAWNSEIAGVQRIKGCVVPSSMPQPTPSDFPSLHGLPKLVIGNKRDTVKPQTKRAPVAPEFRNVDSIESSADPFAMETHAFFVFIERVVAFANRAPSFPGASSASNYSASPSSTGPFAEGLRQMKSKVSAPGSAPGSSSNSNHRPPLSTGSSGTRTGWW